MYQILSYLRINVKVLNKWQKVPKNSFELIQNNTKLWQKYHLVAKKLNSHQIDAKIIKLTPNVNKWRPNIMKLVPKVFKNVKKVPKWYQIFKITSIISFDTKNMSKWFQKSQSGT